MRNFMAPIPGMSLTREKGNAPWEQPPLYSKPQEALAFYLDKLSDEETLEDMLFVLEQGLPVSSFIDAMTSYGVMQGYHTIDVKVLVSPVLHEHIVTLADTLGIDVIEEDGPSEEERKEKKFRERLVAMMADGFDDAPEAEDLDQESMEEADTLIGSEDEEPSFEEIETEEDEVESPPLISRRN